jgi:hypothetical protein
MVSAGQLRETNVEAATELITSNEFSFMFILLRMLQDDVWFWN